MLQNLNKAFENRNRLGIMSILIVNDWMSFNDLKELLSLSDGNLSSHILFLEKLNYLEVKKEFIGRRPSTSYRITQEGRTAFKRHIEALENILKNMK
jgi:DNA-binding MarR family transcriptional regulator